MLEKSRQIRPLLSILIAVLIASTFKLLFLDIMRVYGRSMEPTIVQGQFLYINRAAYGMQIPIIDKYLFLWKTPRPGEIVVFRSPLDSRMVVKRCMASEKHPLEVEQDRIKFNGLSFSIPPYLFSSIKDLSRVPNGMVFVAGDNQKLSLDSRNYGFIPIKNIIGKVIFSDAKSDG